MIGKIVKEITKTNSGIYNILGDDVYPMQLPETDKPIVPSAIYSISDMSDGMVIHNKVISFNIIVTFRVITDKYSKLDDLVTSVIKGFLSTNGNIGNTKINYIKLVNSSDVFNNEQKLYGNEILFQFNVS